MFIIIIIIIRPITDDVFGTIHIPSRDTTIDDHANVTVHATRLHQKNLIIVESHPNQPM